MSSIRHTSIKIPWLVRSRHCFAAFACFIFRGVLQRSLVGSKTGTAALLSCQSRYRRMIPASGDPAETICIIGCLPALFILVRVHVLPGLQSANRGLQALHEVFGLVLKDMDTVFGAPCRRISVSDRKGSSACWVLYNIKVKDSLLVIDSALKEFSVLSRFHVTTSNVILISSTVTGFAEREVSFSKSALCCCCAFLQSELLILRSQATPSI